MSAKRKTGKHEAEAMPPTAEISPLDLATLSARLATAGLIDRNGGHHAVITRALEFLRLCAEVPAVLKRHHEWKRSLKDRGARLDRLAAGCTAGASVPIATLLEWARADRLTLSREELTGVGIEKEWDELPPDERAVAVFRRLACKPVTHDGEIPLHDGSLVPRNGQSSLGGGELIIADCGVSVEMAKHFVVEFLEDAKRQRNRERNRAAGGKKKKPQKLGADEQFISEADARAVDGTWKAKDARPHRKKPEKAGQHQ